MAYYDSVLENLPITAFRLNTAETSYVDISGRGAALSGTLAFAPSIVAGNSKSIFLNGVDSLNFSTSVFKRGNENSPFTLAAWFFPATSAGTLSIMSHNGIYDGLVFDGNGIKFRIKTNTGGFIETFWPVPDFMEAYYVVGVYTSSKIQLYINNELVDETEMPEWFLADGFAQEPSAALYMGQSPVNTERATIDGVAAYAKSLSGQSVVKTFNDGRDVLPMTQIVGSKGGAMWDGTVRNKTIYEEYGVLGWGDGITDGVSFTDGYLRPQNDPSTNLSTAGTYVIPVPVGVLTLMHGMKVEWDGDGVFIVETSINAGTTWSPVENGTLATNTHSADSAAINVALVRVSFNGGIEEDPSVVRRLAITVYPDNTIISNNNGSRSIAVTNGISTATFSNEPIERNTRSGFYQYGATGIYLGLDTSEDPKTVASIEVWVRMVRTSSGAGGYIVDTRAGSEAGDAYLWIPDASDLISFGGMSSVYLNGEAVANNVVPMRYEQWNHFIMNLTTPANLDARFGSANFLGQFGLIATYPTSFNADNATELYKSYSKMPTSAITDTGAVGIAEAPTPFNIYSYSWDISAGG